MKHIFGGPKIQNENGKVNKELREMGGGERRENVRKKEDNLKRKKMYLIKKVLDRKTRVYQRVIFRRGV